LPAYIPSSGLRLPNHLASTPPLTSQVENSVAKTKRPNSFRVIGASNPERVIISKDDFPKVEDGEIALYALGVVTYTDAFVEN
jgi:hypothetical protein